jgi:signal peptidase II
VRFTLVFNKGAAFGTTVGESSRWIFTALAAVILFVLIRMAHQASATERWKLLALGMVCGGALGNLIDRLRWTRGVVDFIDIGTATWRWPTFNVADIAVTTGAVLLAIVLWREDRAAAREAALVAASPIAPPGVLDESIPVDGTIPVAAERRGIA